MEKLKNNLLQFVYALKNDFNGLYADTYGKTPRPFGESYISIIDENLAEDLSKIFSANREHTKTVVEHVCEMDELIDESISNDGIICNCGWFPFLTCSTFKYKQSIGEGRSEVRHETLLSSAFDIEDFNKWVDKETNFDFPTKEVLKLGVEKAYESSEKGYANGLDYAYLDVILYLTNFFESYNTHLKNQDKDND